MGETRSRKLPMVWVVGGAFVTLVGVAIALVLTLSIRANFSNTFSLLNDKAVLITQSLEYRLRANLDPAAETVSALQRLYGDGVLDIADTQHLQSVLAGSLAANSAVEALLVTDLTDRDMGAFRSSGGAIVTRDWRNAPPERRRGYLQANVAESASPIWGPLVTVPQGVFTNVTVPLIRGGTVEAYLTAAISTDFLTRIVRELDLGEQNSNFIVSQGSQVLAFSDLEELQRQAANANMRLPMSVERFADPVLRKLADAPVLERFSAARAEGVEVRYIEAADKEYVLMSRSLVGYGPHTWTIGAYFQQASLAGEVQRVMISGITGVIALIVASLLAFWLARRATQPLSHIAEQSRHVAAMELDEIKPLPHSRMAEIDQLAVAFNGMVAGLRALNTYVPASLFRKLMGLGIAEAARSREAELTIIFTDIAGFTEQSESMGAGEVAEFLNAHFAVLVRAVEDEDGTVDKFMGDGMLAFWGAPDARADHAQAAVRAAAAMNDAQQAANRQAQADGRAPTRLRIGIHTGRVIVGNIGAYDRVDYTIVGDAVNVSQRLQELGRNVAPEAETVVLASDATVRALSVPVPRVPAGRHHLRGRGAEIEVWRLFAGGGE